jgi:hypothetical protein
MPGFGRWERENVSGVDDDRLREVAGGKGSWKAAVGCDIAHEHGRSEFRGGLRRIHRQVREQLAAGTEPVHAGGVGDAIVGHGDAVRLAE